MLLVAPDVMAELHERWMDEPGRPTSWRSRWTGRPTPRTRGAHGTPPDATGPRRCSATWCCARRSPATQARKAGHKLSDELHLLTVHGVLHLLGYDHGEPDDEREMFALQNQLLDRWQRSRTEAAERRRQRSADARSSVRSGWRTGDAPVDPTTSC